MIRTYSIQTYGHLVRELDPREVRQAVLCWHGCGAPATHHCRWFGTPRSGSTIPWDGISRWVCSEHARRFAERFRVQIVPTWPFGVGI